jgi:hypothetical protein
MNEQGGEALWPLTIEYQPFICCFNYFSIELSLADRRILLADLGKILLPVKGTKFFPSPLLYLLSTVFQQGVWGQTYRIKDLLFPHCLCFI